MDKPVRPEKVEKLMLALSKAHGDIFEKFEATQQEEYEVRASHE